MSSEKDSVYSTMVFFGLVSLAVYFLLLRPLLSGGGDLGREQQQIPGEQHGGRPRVAPAPHRTQAAGSEDRAALNATFTRVPDHLSPQSAQLASVGGSNLLIDGLLAFRHGKASQVEQSLDSNQQALNRRDRARILTRLMDDEAIKSPPAKGCTLIVAIPAEDVMCEKLRRVLYLLGTYCNLLVILAMSESQTDEDRLVLITKLRGSDQQLSSDVLPDHRVVAASTFASRIAFVRQIERLELVLEFDPSVKAQLTRFGHRVVVYSNGKVAGAKSKLGASFLT